MISSQAFAYNFYIETPGPTGVEYTSAGNTGAYLAKWNGLVFNCTNSGVVKMNQGKTDLAGSPNPYPNGYPDGWYISTSWTAADFKKWQYGNFYTHLPQFNEVNQFICTNTNNLAPNYTTNGVSYNCKHTPGRAGWIVEESSCNGWTCNMRNLPSCGQFGCQWWSGGTNYCIRSAEQPAPPPPPEPVITTNPCPSGSSTLSRSSGKRMADSTSIGGTLCAETTTIGFDANGVANSMIIDHYIHSTESASKSVAGVVNAIRSGGADSTSIGAIPTTANYSSATLEQNANGQTQLKGWSNGTQTIQ